MKTLWINADDFALTPAVTLGICEAMLEGGVGGTTAMVCRTDSLDSLAAFAARVAGRVGLHLQLTDGVPRSGAEQVPSLVGEDGRFPRKRWGVRSPDPGEVAREWEAQLATLRAAGVEPSHLDSHHDVHLLPGVFEVYADFARRHRLPARGGSRRHVELLRRRGVAASDAFAAGFGQGEIGIEELLRCAESAASRVPEGGSVELMSHPGRVDDALRRRSVYVDQRERELAVLCSPELPGRLRERGLELSPRPVFAADAGG